MSVAADLDHKRDELEEILSHLSPEERRMLRAIQPQLAKRSDAEIREFARAVGGLIQRRRLS